MAIGSAANLAAALDKAPEIVPLAKRVVYMAGAFFIPHWKTPLERLNCLNAAAEYVQMKKEMQTRFMGLSRCLKSAYGICFPSGELTEKETATAQFIMGPLSRPLKNI